MSKITDISNYYPKPAPTDTVGAERLNRGTHPAVERENEVKPTDTVTLSGTSREMQIAKDAVQAAPDVRPARVEELRSAIQEGRYTVDAEKIAEKMIGTIISERV